MGTINGRVLDQDGNPVAGVSIINRQYEMRGILPILWGPTFKVDKEGTCTTNSDGEYTFRHKYEWIDYAEVKKEGYHCESLKPTFINQEEHNFDNPTLWIFKLNDDEKENVVISASEDIPLRELQKVYFSIVENKFTDSPSTESDLVIARYKRIGKEFYPFVIRALSGGIYCCRNDMTYAPKQGYEPGIILNTRYRSSDWVPFFYHSKDKNIYSRLWLKLGAKGKTVSIEYAYNKSGSRYIDFDFHAHKKKKYLTTFASIERAVPLESEWWAYIDRSRFTLITSEERFREIWKKYRNTYVEPHIDSGRVFGNGGLTRVNRFLANAPLAPRDVLSELSKTDNIQFASILLENPSLSDSDFDELIKLVRKSHVAGLINERDSHRDEWEYFLHNFAVEQGGAR